MKCFCASLLILFSALVVLAIGCNSSKEESRKLAIKAEKGKSYTFSLLRAAEQQRDERILSDTLFLDGKLELVNSTDSLLVVRFTFSRLAIRRQVPEVKIKNEGKLMAGRITFGPELIFKETDSILSRIAGMSLLLTLNDKGEVKQIDGVDIITDRLSALSMSNNFSVAGLLKDYVSNDAIKDIFNQASFLLPGKEVKVGDRWANEYLLVTKAPVKMSNVYLLEQENNDTAGVQVQSVISATTGEGGRTYLKGRKHGFAKINLKTGFPYSYESNTESVITTDHYDVKKKEKLLVYVSE